MYRPRVCREIAFGPVEPDPVSCARTACHWGLGDNPTSPTGSAARVLSRQNGLSRRARTDAHAARLGRLEGGFRGQSVTGNGTNTWDWNNTSFASHGLAM